MIIDNTNISMIRGDSESITLTLYDNNGEVKRFEEGDKVYFTVKEDITTSKKLIQKVVTTFTEDGKAIIEIDPADTKPLQFKAYLYDIQLTSSLGKVTTIIPPSRFIVRGEVTHD